MKGGRGCVFCLRQCKGAQTWGFRTTVGQKGRVAGRYSRGSHVLGGGRSTEFSQVLHTHNTRGTTWGDLKAQCLRGGEIDTFKTHKNENNACETHQRGGLIGREDAVHGDQI